MKIELWRQMIALTLLLFLFSISCQKPDDNAPVVQLASVTTSEASKIIVTSATCGGEITSDGGGEITERGVCWSFNFNPTINDSRTSDGNGTGIFVSSLTNLSAGTTYHVRAYATNGAGTAYGNDIHFTTTKVNSANTVVDADGNTYNSVTIGSQIWMKENLKTTKYNDGTPISLVTDSAAWKTSTNGAYTWYKNDATTFGNTYGALYNWYAVNTGKLCPAGWHAPTDDEWTVLENFLISSGYNYDGTTIGDRETNNKIAKSLADKVGWLNSSQEGVPGNTDFPAIRDATGFKAMPGGYRDFFGSFVLTTFDGVWWSSSEIVPTATTVWVRQINFTFKNVLRPHYEKYYGLSVRCVKD